MATEGSIPSLSENSIEAAVQSIQSLVESDCADAKSWNQASESFIMAIESTPNLTHDSYDEALKHMIKRITENPANHKIPLANLRCADQLKKLIESVSEMEQRARFAERAESHGVPSDLVNILSNVRLCQMSFNKWVSKYKVCIIVSFMVSLCNV